MVRETLASKRLSCGHASVGPWQAKKIVLIIFILFLASQSIAQPQATLSFYPQTVPMNRDMGLVLSLVWAGEADVYDIPQPDLSGLPEFQVLELKLSATRKGSENRMTYALVMKPLEEGEYDLGRIRVEYFEKGRDVPIPVPLPRTLVRVVSPELLGRRTKAAIAFGAAVTAAAVAAILIVRSKKISRRKELDESETARHTRAGLLAKLDEVRPFLIEGEVGIYLEKLCELAESDVLRPYAEKTDELRELAEGVKFGGQTSSPDQLNWSEKLVRNAIRKAFPNQDEQMEEE